jgi:putative nucleotidyltransferase with HDIG domain
MLHVLELGYGGYALKAAFASIDLTHHLLSLPLAPHRFTMVDWVGRTHDPFCIPAVVVDAERLPRAHALDYVPLDACPITGVLPEARAFVGEIAADPLRLFVHRVFEDREIFSRFWTLPASARHHHAYPGGLAEHSVEVAEDISSQGQLTGTERDLALAGALLHDIGKVWGYTSDMFPSAAGLAMGHELLGLARLEAHLNGLETLWADGAYAMRVLLSGCSRMRPDGSLPSALVTRIRAADQRSCERNTGHPARRNRSWIPKPWAQEETSKGPGE